jgi:glycosyltransferase involved in cell wall biosynthesis
MRADLSAIITCYNKDEYLQECIDSVINQSLQPQEIILVHDGCQREVSYEKAVTILHGKNKGVVRARDTGVRMARSKYILFVDADDWLSLDYIQKGMRDLEKADITYPDFMMVYTDKPPLLIETPKRITPKLMMKHCRIPVSCLMKKDTYVRLGGFKNFPLYEDWDFWLRAMTLDLTFKKFESVLYYRQYPGSRNRQEHEMKMTYYQKIKDQFEIINNTLRTAYGKKEV